MSVSAQEANPGLPIYYVQEGDTLTSIANRFGIAPEDLLAVNSIADPNTVSVGTALGIPGIEGIQGVLTTQPVGFGETLRTISRTYQIPIDMLARINHLTSPSELYAGVNLILPDQPASTNSAGRGIIASGESLLELAVLGGTDPWTVASINELDGRWAAYPGEALFYPSDTPASSGGTIHPKITDFSFSPLPLVQGETAELKLTTVEPVTLTGNLAGNELHFFSEEANHYVALQGIYAMANPGLVPLTLTGTFQDGTTFSFEQMIVLDAGGFATEELLGVDPVTLDPAVTKPENELIQSIIKNITPVRYWQGPFLVPGYDPNWITSWYGTRRTYNNDPTVYFHTGLDYGGGTGLEIKSPAAGVVVFANALTVRGNATIIDHGWGVYSGLYHQSEFTVNVGDRVEAGQVVGLIGATGRVTGAHLHWDVWVNGVQVNPFDWLDNAYPTSAAANP
ncbi:MAG TPA: peptidoglycan DD-metalloendopeptidase family protein [Anaerolineaceae bacterium]|nr:peptidoglycan DD-metalloendopeptidase family protein [Anaerolineaceae bacterium]